MITMKEKYQAQYLKANVDTNLKIRREDFEGVEHLVVPVIAAKQMVMNGLFYPAEEFRDWVETWNGVPVPISHPQVNGVAISARAPRIQELTSVGWFFNVEFTKDNKLKGEVWLNTEKAKKLNADYLIEKFENGEIMEVSTGLFSNLEMISGEYEGDPYSAIVRHIRPDHLALLPNEVGACSVEDGCGTMRSNCAGCNGTCNDSKKTVREKINKALRLVGEKLGFNVNKESFNEIRERVHDSLKTVYPQDWVFILDLYEDMVIYEVESNSTLYKRSYVIAEGKAVLGDDTQEVVRKTTYSPVISSNELNNGGNKMDKEKIIQNIIAKATNKFTQEDKASLEGLSDDVLAKMAINEDEAPEESDVETVESETDSPEQENKSETEEPSTEQKVNSLLDGVEDSEVKEFLGNAVKEHTAKKEALINGIISNSSFTKEEVQVMPFNQLQKLADSVKKPSFNGRGTSLTQPTANSDYKVPSIFDVKESK